MSSHIREQTDTLEKLRLDYVHGAIAGLIGGITMAMVTMMLTGMMGMGIWAMPKMIGGLALGPQAVMTGGVAVIVAGLMIHMMLSVMFGLVYAMIVNVVTRELWLTGLTLGIALWLVNFYAVGAVWPAAAMMQKEPLALAALSHLVFGTVTALVASRFVRRAHAAA